MSCIIIIAKDIIICNIGNHVDVKLLMQTINCSCCRLHCEERVIRWRLGHGIGDRVGILWNLGQVNGQVARCQSLHLHCHLIGIGLTISEKSIFVWQVDTFSPQSSSTNQRGSFVGRPWQNVETDVSQRSSKQLDMADRSVLLTIAKTKRRKVIAIDCIKKTSTLHQVLKTVNAYGILGGTCVDDSPGGCSTVDCIAIPSRHDATQIHEVGFALATKLALERFALETFPIAWFPFRFSFELSTSKSIRTVLVSMTRQTTSETSSWTFRNTFARARRRRRRRGCRRNHSLATVGLWGKVTSGLPNFANGFSGIFQGLVSFRWDVVGLNQLHLSRICRLLVRQHLAALILRTCWLPFLPVIIIRPVRLGRRRPICIFNPPCIFIPVICIPIRIAHIFIPDSTTFGMWPIRFISKQSPKGTPDQNKAGWISCLHQHVLFLMAWNAAGTKQPVTSEFVLKEDMGVVWNWKLRIHGPRCIRSHCSSRRAPRRRLWRLPHRRTGLSRNTWSVFASTKQSLLQWGEQLLFSDDQLRDWLTVMSLQVVPSLKSVEGVRHWQLLQRRRTQHIQKGLEAVFTFILFGLQISNHALCSTCQLTPKSSHNQWSFRLLCSTLKPSSSSHVGLKGRRISVPSWNCSQLVAHGLNGLQDRCSPGYSRAPRVAPLPCTTISCQHTASEQEANALPYFLAWSKSLIPPSCERPADDNWTHACGYVSFQWFMLSSLNGLDFWDHTYATSCNCITTNIYNLLHASMTLHNLSMQCLYDSRVSCWYVYTTILQPLPFHRLILPHCRWWHLSSRARHAEKCGEFTFKLPLWFLSKMRLPGHKSPPIKLANPDTMSLAQTACKQLQPGRFHQQLPWKIFHGMWNGLFKRLRTWTNVSSNLGSVRNGPEMSSERLQMIEIIHDEQCLTPGSSLFTRTDRRIEADDIGQAIRVHRLPDCVRSWDDLINVKICETCETRKTYTQKCV